MTDRRTLAVAAIIATFMAVTVGHVAHYAGGFEDPGWAWLGWFYALAVDAAIVVCAWLTRWTTTRRWAWLGYFAFVAASGAMNAAAIKPWLEPGIEAIFAWIYSLFPTAAIGLLGFLARQAEAVAQHGRRRGAWAALSTRITAAIAGEPGAGAGGTAPAPPQIAQVAQPEPQPVATIADFRRIFAGMNGDRPQGTDFGAADAAELVQGAGLALPSRRTLQAWAQEVRDAAD